MSSDGIELKDVLNITHRASKGNLVIITIIVPLVITAAILGITYGVNWWAGLITLIILVILSFVFISMYNKMCYYIMERNFEKIN